MGRKHHNRNHASKEKNRDPVLSTIADIISNPCRSNGTYGELDPDAFGCDFGFGSDMEGLDDYLVEACLINRYFGKSKKSKGKLGFSYNPPIYSEISKYTKFSTIKSKNQKGKNEMAKVYKQEVPHLFVIPSVYEKMESLLFAAKDKEIAWHGFVRRIGDPSQMVFELYDLIVYPQTVTGGTTTSDEEEYAKWYIKEVMSREDSENFKFHGHSHVNMGCTPSSTDNTFRNDILQNITVENDDYYIFMIMNKKGEYTIELYYPKDNIVYQGTEKASDIFLHECSYEDYEDSIDWAKEQAEANIKEHKVTTYYSGGTYSANKHWDAATNSWVENTPATSSTPVKTITDEEAEWAKTYGGPKKYGYGPRQIYFTSCGYRAEGKWYNFTEEQRKAYDKSKYDVESPIKAAFYKACNDRDEANKPAAPATTEAAPATAEAAKVITTEGGNNTWKEQNSQGPLVMKPKELPSEQKFLTPLEQHMMHLETD